MNDESELIASLHKLADWIEKDNHLQCHSVPRKAAYTIAKLAKENDMFRIYLNKPHFTIKERVLMAVGKVMVMLYKFKKKFKKRK
jgi:hypothetical protein